MVHLFHILQLNIITVLSVCVFSMLICHTHLQWLSSHLDTPCSFSGGPDHPSAPQLYMMIPFCHINVSVTK